MKSSQPNNAKKVADPSQGSVVLLVHLDSEGNPNNISPSMVKNKDEVNSDSPDSANEKTNSVLQEPA